MELRDEKIKDMVLETIEIAKTKYDFIIHNFCIMDNHVHLLIEPEAGQSLSKIMQWIKCNSAKKWNKLHGKKGHLWGDRFFSRIIQNIEDFLRVFHYIDENPVKAGLVKDAKSWKFGGLFHHIHKILSITIAPDNLVREYYPAHVAVR